MTPAFDARSDLIGSGWLRASADAMMPSVEENPLTQALEAVQRDYDRVATAIAYLDARAPEQPTVAEVAAHLGLSTAHLRRLFSRWAGIAPKAFLRHVTAGAAREALRERSVLDATLAIGLTSPGRLHDLLVTVDGLTPGEARRGGDGLTILVGVHPTPLGEVVVGVTRRGVCALAFLDVDESPARARRRVADRWPGAELVDDPGATRAAAESVAGALRGALDRRPVRLVVHGTNLQVKVWEALLRIPPGSVATYGQVAAAVGHPGAARAVGNAVAANPVGVLIPCHRVLRSTGSWGGYRWGTPRKRALLALEAAESGPERISP